MLVTTQADSLVHWVEEPRNDRGISFLEENGYRHLSYGELARQTKAFAALFQDHIGPGDRVAIVLPKPREFVIALYASLYVGATPVPLPPPTLFDEREDYREHIAPIVRNAQPGALITASEFAPMLDLFATGLRLLSFPETLSHTSAAAPTAPADVALLQYTSGSTGAPRGVVVRAANLLANIRMTTVSWLDSMNGCDGDFCSTWLPTHHDMGLVGMLMAPVHIQINVMMMTPEQFVRRPGRWLASFAEDGGTLTAAPPFGYRLALRRAASSPPDLSRWRVAICGAEPVDAVLLRDFARAYGPAGFDPATFCPAYGMAEATLAVTGVPPSETAQAVRVASDLATYGEEIRVEDVRPFDTIPSETNAGWVVSCGPPVGDTEVQVRDDDGQPCRDEVVGEVWVRGSGVCEGYHRLEGDSTFTSGWLRTGDAGFLMNGELYVLGRIADRVKVRGMSVFAEELESRLRRRLGLRADSLLVVPTLRPGHQGVAVLWERRGASPSVEEAAAALATGVRAICGGAMDVDVFALSPGSIPRTTSGKPRRRRAWTDLARGRHDAPAYSARHTSLVEV